MHKTKTRMDTIEKLIKCVREHPVLYNTDHELYKATKLKDEIWNKIARQCNIESVKVAKKLWQNLRDCHRDAIKRGEKRTVPGTVVKPWRHREAMSFLEPYVTRRNNQTITSSVEAETSIEEEMPTLEPNRSRYAENEEQLKQIQRKNRLLKIKVEKNPKSIKYVSNPALRSFFMSLYETSVHFPADIQCRMKRKLFNIISEYEEQLTDSTLINSGASTPSDSNHSFKFEYGSETEQICADDEQYIMDELSD